MKLINKHKFKYELYRLLQSFAFGKLKNEIYNKKIKYKCLIKNQINGKGNKYSIEQLEKFGIKLTINGDNNEITIGNKSQIDNNLIIEIEGSNNKVNLGNIVIGTSLHLQLGFSHCKTSNSEITIGDSTFGQVYIMLMENRSKCLIGNYCLFSGNITINLSDTHSLLDLNGKILNYGGKVIIGDKVWCGKDVKILKHVKISSDTMIGTGSIITGQFDESNVVIAGNPGKIIKRGIKWITTPPQIYAEMNPDKI